MEELISLEAGLAEFEHLAGQPVTIIDFDGMFDGRRRCRLFTPLRASHKKIGACRAIFSGRCIGHCRRRLTGACLKAAAPFASDCPFGIRQLVFPLRLRMVNCGIMFIGAWRTGEAPEEQSGEFRREYAALPFACDSREKALLQLGEVYADGVIHYLFRRGLLTDSPDLRSARIRDFLQERIAAAVGLPDLAAELGLSPSHTSVLVKKLFGCSFSQLLQRLRVAAATHYLTGTELNLHEIARHCGFSSEFHLSRVFRQHTGLPPGRYRARAERNPLGGDF